MNSIEKDENLTTLKNKISRKFINILKQELDFNIDVPVEILDIATDNHSFIISLYNMRIIITVDSISNTFYHRINIINQWLTGKISKYESENNEKDFLNNYFNIYYGLSGGISELKIAYKKYKKFYLSEYIYKKEDIDELSELDIIYDFFNDFRGCCSNYCLIEDVTNYFNLENYIFIHKLEY